MLVNGRGRQRRKSRWWAGPGCRLVQAGKPASGYFLAPLPGLFRMPDGPLLPILGAAKKCRRSWHIAVRRALVPAARETGWRPAPQRLKGEKEPFLWLARSGCFSRRITPVLVRDPTPLLGADPGGCGNRSGSGSRTVFPRHERRVGTRSGQGRNTRRTAGDLTACSVAMPICPHQYSQTKDDRKSCSFLGNW